jgi:sorting nexin-4
MDHGDFDDVTWRSGTSSQEIDPATHATTPEPPQEPPHGKRRVSGGVSDMEPQAGLNADAGDLAGIGDGRLECVVDTPQTENQGTKDAFVSYLVTTDVSFPGEVLV